MPPAAELVEEGRLAPVLLRSRHSLVLFFWRPLRLALHPLNRLSQLSHLVESLLCFRRCCRARLFR